MSPERRLNGKEQSTLPRDLKRVFDDWGVDTVAFDFDDTLIGTGVVYSQALRDIADIFAQVNKKDIPASDIKERMLDPIIRGLRHEFGIHLSIVEATVLICAKWLRLDQASEPVQIALERVQDIHRKDIPQVFDGAIETVDAINSTGVRAVLVTHASPEWTWHKRISCGLVGKFADVYCLSTLKPKAVQWEEMLRQASIDPKHLLVIGDNKEGDILPPTQLGAKGIWVTNGGRKPFSVEHAASHNPNLRVMEANSISEIPEVIIKNFSASL